MTRIFCLVTCNSSTWRTASWFILPTLPFPRSSTRRTWNFFTTFVRGQFRFGSRQSYVSSKIVFLEQRVTQRISFDLYFQASITMVLVVSRPSMLRHDRTRLLNFSNSDIWRWLHGGHTTIVISRDYANDSVTGCDS